MITFKNIKSWPWILPRIILGLSALLYAVPFIPLYSSIGPGAGLLAAPPVLTAAWLFGLRAGVLTALFTFPASVLLILISGDTLGQALLPSNLLGHGFLLLVAVTVGRMRDLSERVREQARELERLALHDHLTGLANRTLFSERMERALKTVGSSREGVAVAFVDLDGFKEINDTLGHEAGDKLLVAVSRRLLNCLRGPDAVGRLGGDEFVVLLTGLAGPENARRAVERLTETLRSPFTIEETSISVTASIGFAFVAAGDANANLMREADAAMYAAKRNGKARYEMFDEQASDVG